MTADKSLSELTQLGTAIFISIQRRDNILKHNREKVTTLADRNAEKSWVEGPPSPALPYPVYRNWWPGGRGSRSVDRVCLQPRAHRWQFMDSVPARIGRVLAEYLLADAEASILRHFEREAASLIARIIAYEAAVGQCVRTLAMHRYEVFAFTQTRHATRDRLKNRKFFRELCHGPCVYHLRRGLDSPTANELFLL
jgi:hypothetical protein